MTVQRADRGLRRETSLGDFYDYLPSGRKCREAIVVDSESGPTPSPVAHGIPAARVETHLPDLGAVRGALGLLLRQGVAPGPRGPWGAPHTPGPHPAPGVA
ncbi:hypothetical protein J6590_056332 [Homalodisca vitripennis]|nr:hypothetical protein J6590_056332 [Homalodisca vitripennis]